MIRYGRMSPQFCGEFFCSIGNFPECSNRIKILREIRIQHQKSFSHRDLEIFLAEEPGIC